MSVQAPTLERAQDLLQKFYGYPDFREGQKKIVASMLEGNDTLGIMPTGAENRYATRSPRCCMRG